MISFVLLRSNIFLINDFKILNLSVAYFSTPCVSDNATAYNLSANTFLLSDELSEKHERTRGTTAKKITRNKLMKRLSVSAVI